MGHRKRRTGPSTTRASSERDIDKPLTYNFDANSVDSSGKHNKRSALRNYDQTRTMSTDSTSNEDIYCNNHKCNIAAAASYFIGFLLFILLVTLRCHTCFLDNNTREYKAWRIVCIICALLIISSVFPIATCHFC